MLILECYLMRVVYVIDDVWPVPLLLMLLNMPTGLQIPLGLHAGFGGLFLHQGGI